VLPYCYPGSEILSF